MNDEEIIHLIKHQKYHPAVKKLYSYFPVVKKMVLKNQGTTSEAEDIFQESLIILYKKVQQPNFELTSKLNTYLFSVNKLLWLEALRKKNKKPLKEVYFNVNENDQTCKSDIESDLPYQQAMQAVMQLGQKCRDILILFYYKKRSLSEIAKEVGFGGAKSAKNQKYRCIEKAKEFIKTNFTKNI